MPTNTSTLVLAAAGIEMLPNVAAARAAIASLFMSSPPCPINAGARREDDKKKGPPLCKAAAPTAATGRVLLTVWVVRRAIVLVGHAVVIAVAIVTIGNSVAV